MKTMVDRFGRVVLPKKVRDELGLIPGTSLDVDTEGDVVRLRPAREAPVLVKRSGVLVFTGLAQGDLARAVEALREARSRHTGGMDRS